MLAPALLEFDVPTGETGKTHRLACTQWGDPEAVQTVLCVHGLTRNGRDFDMLAAALAADYHILCPDIPGRGRSGWLADAQGYNSAAYIADVLWLLKHFSITRVHWIGTSMGGIMGMLAANMQPGLIDALVLNDIGCLIPASGVARIRDIADFKTAYASRAEAEDNFRKRCATFGIREEWQWQHLLTYGLEEKDGMICFTYDPAIFSVAAAGFSKDTPAANIDLWPYWEAVTKIPTLLIRGADSDILPRDTALQMQARHPRFTLYEAPGCGHAPSLMDDPQIRLVQEWFKNVENRP